MVHVYRLVTANSVEEKIIERAKIKLKLDAVVVQQGRLADKSKVCQCACATGRTKKLACVVAQQLSKQDMIAMIQFGAEAAFRTDDLTITGVFACRGYLRLSFTCVVFACC